MNENPLENPIIPEKKTLNRLPLGPRNHFQMEVFNELGIADNMSMIEKYGRVISDYIDDSNNVKIRQMILDVKPGESYEEAAKTLILTLQSEGKLPKAA